MSEAIAKHVVACNHCNAEIGQHYPAGHKNISVALLSQPAENGGTYKETHHFCDEACLAAHLTKKFGTANAAIAAFTAIAKHLTQCDNCKASLKNEGDDKKQHIAATLANGKDENQQYHYCDAECLRQHLNSRSKRKRERSNASFEEGAYFSNGALFLNIADARDISYKERNSKKEYFLDEERKSFPIMNCQDVKAAVHAWGRYKGSMSFEQFKTKLTRRAHELGCSLPEK